MWFCKKKQVVETPVVVAKQSREALEEKVKQLENEVNQYKEWYKQMIDTARDSEIAVDFKSIDAFSVERVIDNNLPKTIIGYVREESGLDSEGKVFTNKGVKEWYYHCSDRRHQELVDKFNKYKKI